MEKSKNLAVSRGDFIELENILETLKVELGGKRAEYQQWFRECKIPVDGIEEQKVTWRVRRVKDQAVKSPEWISQIKLRLEGGVYKESIIDLSSQNEMKKYLENFSPEGVIEKARYSFPPELLAMLEEDCRKAPSKSFPDTCGIQQFDIDLVHEPATAIFLEEETGIQMSTDKMILLEELITDEKAVTFNLIRGNLIRFEAEFKTPEAMKACCWKEMVAVFKKYLRAKNITPHKTTDGQRSAARAAYLNHIDTEKVSPLDYYFAHDATQTERQEWQNQQSSCAVRPSSFPTLTAA